MALANQCAVDIWVALHYKDTSENWVSDGFWTLEPGETREFFNTTADHFYYYAQSEGRDQVWKGKDHCDSLYDREYCFSREYISKREGLLALSCDNE